MNRLPARRGSAAVATAALAAAALTTLAAPVNATAPATLAAHASTNVWFHDPVSSAARKAEIAVPKHPANYSGKLRHTKATDRTHSGRVAVPVSWAHGHELTTHQAVVLNKASLFAFDKATPTTSAKSQIKKLNASLANVTAVRCEGYTDFGGSTSHESALSKKRAAAVCKLVKSHRSSVKTTTAGYGGKRPVIVGGTVSDRAQNRRVVVEVTAVKKTKTTHHVPSGPTVTVPSAPTLTTATAGDASAAIAFTAPTSTGGSAITGYQVSVDGGTTWTHLTTSGSGPITATLADLTNGTTYPVTVRAINAAGDSVASNTLSVTPVGPPSAPTITASSADYSATYPNAYMDISFTPPTNTGGSPITSYQYTLDGENWTTFTYTAGTPNTAQISVYWHCGTFEKDIAVRAVNAIGAGPYSNIAEIDFDDSSC